MSPEAFTDLIKQESPRWARSSRDANLVIDERRARHEITDVTLTRVTWDGLPPTEYTSNLVNLTQESVLGLVRIRPTRASKAILLGSTMRPATLDGPAVIEWLKPMLMGQDPSSTSGSINACASGSRTFTMKPMGAVDVALWDLAGRPRAADPPAARHVSDDDPVYALRRT